MAGGPASLGLQDRVPLSERPQCATNGTDVGWNSHALTRRARSLSGRTCESTTSARSLMIPTRRRSIEIVRVITKGSRPAYQRQVTTIDAHATME